MLNAKKGGLISDLIVEDTKPAAPPQQETAEAAAEREAKKQGRMAAEAAKIAALAESSMDARNISKSIKKTDADPAFNRSYLVRRSNIARMEEIKEKIGADFSFQVNRALEYWFENVHPKAKS